jgi:hypothetical protein
LLWGRYREFLNCVSNVDEDELKCKKYFIIEEYRTIEKLINPISHEFMTIMVQLAALLIVVVKNLTVVKCSNY